jgi:GT2 family glycosyltransferase
MPAVLSIIIVAYQSRGELPACLESIPREIGGEEVEVCVIDNSRDADGTLTLLRAVYPWVRAITPETNLGFGRANNRGLHATRGALVLFLNPDTVLRPGVIEALIARLRAEPGIGLISPRLELADGTMDLACRRGIPSVWDGFCRAAGLARWFPRTRWFCGYNLTHLPERETYDVGAINGAFMLGPRDLITQLGGFDERFFMYGDDLDLCLRVRQAGRRIVYDGRWSIVHLKGQSVDRDFERMSEAIFDANREVFLKHFNPRRSRWVEWRYRMAFGLWKWISRGRARWSGRRRVQPR